MGFDTRSIALLIEWRIGHASGLRADHGALAQMRADRCCPTDCISLNQLAIIGACSGIARLVTATSLQIATLHGRTGF